MTQITALLDDHKNHLANKSFRETCPALTDCGWDCAKFRRGAEEIF